MALAVALPARRADMVVAALAQAALAAADQVHRLHADALPLAETGDALADRGDAAGQLVAGGAADRRAGRGASRVSAAVGVEVGAADAGRADVDERLARAWPRVGDLFDADVFAAVEHGCLHGIHLLR